MILFDVKRQPSLDSHPPRFALLVSLLAVGSTLGCGALLDSPPQTSVVLENRYPTAPTDALVVYDAYWQNVSFKGQPLAPGTASAPQDAVPASADNRAFVVLAPGWDPSSTPPTTKLVVMQSRSGFAIALGDTLRIPVDDEHFIGNCAAGSSLTQEQADFLTQIVFTADFAGRRYDASTCSTTPQEDAVAP
ncbi:hypothetical protein AKJ09_11082 [Labilithrix luteola]|uniref:Lipoprotein n=1 Tax=Labilithrix luteola TaxID=1391654 RepID=A0A0K1QF81_9BACT|nr:hypothetical protein [Labilithrix luteola]AKV04419.1 hypothetical protein AKJ09_11082 [Labilithrix luteola]